MELKKRGNTYYVHFEGPGGQRLRLSCRTGDFTAAQLAAVEIVRRALVTDDNADNAAGVQALGLDTLSDMLQSTWIDSWVHLKSARSIRHRIRRVAADLGHLTWPQLTYPRIHAWAETLDNRNRKRTTAMTSAATKNRYVSLISTAMTHHRRKAAVPLALPEFPSWSEDNVKERYLSREEEARLIAFFKAKELIGGAGRSSYEYMHALLILLVDTGMRAGEALALSADNVQPSLLAPEYVILRRGTTKSGEGRSVPLTTRARVAVADMLRHPVHGSLNSHRAGQRWSNILARVGIEGVTLHTLRHTCASRLVQAGVPLYTVRLWLGHSSVTVTERYAHLSPDNVLHAVAALEPVRALPESPPEPTPAAAEPEASRPTLRIVR